MRGVVFINREKQRISRDAMLVTRVSAKGTLLRKARGLSVSCNGQSESLGMSFEFSSRRRESLSAKLHITISRFDVRETGENACLRACEHVALPCHRVHAALVPLALDKGIGDVRGVLVVIGVGRVDHLNTRHCNHDRVLFLFLTHFLAVRPFPLA